MMTICKKYRDNYNQYSKAYELIEIVRADNDRYFVDYGVTYHSDGRRDYKSSAGYFASLEDAEAALHKHRPHAESA